MRPLLQFARTTLVGSVLFLVLVVLLIVIHTPSTGAFGKWCATGASGRRRNADAETDRRWLGQALARPGLALRPAGHRHYAHDLDPHTAATIAGNAAPKVARSRPCNHGRLYFLSGSAAKKRPLPQQQ